MIIILGLHRSGSSCLAGVLHRLGVYMGSDFRGCEPDGGYEDRQLSRLCERAMRFPYLNPRQSITQFAENARGWVVRHNSSAEVVGAKYPHLCHYVRSLESLTTLKIVHASRPLEESIQSLIKRSGKRQSHKQLENVQRFLWQQKTEFLDEYAAKVDGCSHYTVEYDQLLNWPRQTISELAEWLGLNCDIADAVTYVKPSKRRIFPVGQESLRQRVAPGR